ncbi:MAG: di-trans,poly-cis-decaprenylcistransferase [Fusobacteria bacterium]|nr:di-trans,poly-cis-decaprenylcistransferase [Fusobacteriota bacterium]
MNGNISLNHIGIIMDGNGRWALKQGKNRVYGHTEGVKNLKNILEISIELGIKYLTVYAFSTENWKRPKSEVDALMFLFKEYLLNEVNNLNKNGIKIVFSGRKNGLNDSLIKLMDDIEEKLKYNDKITLNIAFNYGGRAEIVDAVNKIIKETDKKIIDEEDIQNHLYQSNIPDPELIIRTSGEFRISNFLLWQIAYSEFYITDKYWPEFNKEEFMKAISSYNKRERKFGGLKI